MIKQIEKKKTLMALALVGLLSTSAFAYSGMNPGDMSQQKSFKKDFKMRYHKKSSPFLSMVNKLNLTAEQKTKIFEIKKEMMKNKKSLNVAFTKTSFDKDKFIEIMKQKRDNMVESKAQMIEKVYAILTQTQKEQLKVLMDLREDKKMAMMEKRMNFDKNCNGRR
ncbi:MAG: Spy/CpxP family protein refolding chaperone [Halarcobacter sp.]